MKSLIAVLIALASLAAHAESDRGGKIVDLELSPVGLMIDKSLALPEEYSVGFHIGDDNVVMAQYQKYSSRLSDHSDGQDVSNFGVYLQHFASNSFYGKVGLNTGKVEYSEWDYTNNRRNYTSGTETRFDFRIGNQWTWGGFILGVDWVGYSIVLVRNVERDDGGAGSFPARALQLTQLHLGFSF
jgi:hypothetical protein